MENRDVAYLLDVICDNMVSATPEYVFTAKAFWEGIFKFYRTNIIPKDNTDLENTFVRLAVRALNDKHISEQLYRENMKRLYAMAYYKGRTAVIGKLDFPLQKEIIKETKAEIDSLVGKIVDQRQKRAGMERAFFDENDQLFARVRKNKWVAKDFVEKFQEYCQQEEKSLSDENKATESLFVMMLGDPKSSADLSNEDNGSEFTKFVEREVDRFSGHGKSCANPNGEGK